MIELTSFKYIQALNNAHEDPESYKIIETLISEYLSMLNHMKRTSLWNVYCYEKKLIKVTTEPMWCEYLMWERTRDGTYPMLLARKYYNDPENDAEVERRMKWRKEGE